MTAAAAVTYATDRNFEREAVVDERALLRDALNRSMGERAGRAIKDEVPERVTDRDVHPSRWTLPARPGRLMTTRRCVGSSARRSRHARGPADAAPTRKRRDTSGGPARIAASERAAAARGRSGPRHTRSHRRA